MPMMPNWPVISVLPSSDWWLQGFLVLSVLLPATGMFCIVGVVQTRNRVVRSYETSIQIAVNALRVQLSIAEALASISLLENKLMRLCASDNTIPDLPQVASR